MFWAVFQQQYDMPPVIIIFLLLSFKKARLKDLVMVYQRQDGLTLNFFEWFNNHFLEYVPSVNPLLLLLDGHLAH